jgi:hypothetical protein
MSTRPALIGFETRLLAELRQVVAERAAAAPYPAAPDPSAPSPAARRQAGRGWPHRRLAMTGVLSAAAAAGLAVTLTVTLTGNGGHPASTPRFAAATTVAAVLNNAALAAQSEPAVTPRPDQFVYLKLLEADSPSDRASTESWTSVSGTRKGLRVQILRYSNQPARRYRSAVAWCGDGFVDGQSRQHCTPQQFAAYRPSLPSTAAGMLAYLAHLNPITRLDPTKKLNPVGCPGCLVTTAFWIQTLFTTDLTPAQQAAMFRALATVPHLQVVPKVADALGRTGVGIRWRDHGEAWTTIFDPRSFRLLGAAFANGHGVRRYAVTVPATVVDQVGQRP